MTTPHTRTPFKQRFLEQTGGAPEDYTRMVLDHTLPFHAKTLLPLVRLLDHRTLAADYDLIEDIGQLTSRRDFAHLASARHFHPANQGPLRKVFKFRVSISKLQKLVYRVMRPASGDEGDSRTPFVRTSPPPEA